MGMYLKKAIPLCGV